MQCVASPSKHRDHLAAGVRPRPGAVATSAWKAVTGQPWFAGGAFQCSLMPPCGWGVAVGAGGAPGAAAAVVKAKTALHALVPWALLALMRTKYCDPGLRPVEYMLSTHGLRDDVLHNTASCKLPR